MPRVVTLIKQFMMRRVESVEVFVTIVSTTHKDSTVNSVAHISLEIQMKIYKVLTFVEVSGKIFRYSFVDKYM